MEQNSIPRLIIQTENELQENFSRTFIMRVEKLSKGKRARLAVFNFDHHAGGDWLGPGRITKYCDKKGIPYRIPKNITKLYPQYITILKVDLSNIDFEELKRGLSGVTVIYPKEKK